MSIRTKLIVFLAIPVVTIYLALMGGAFWANRNLAIQNKSTAVNNLVRGYAAFLDSQFNSLAATLESVRFLLEKETSLNEEILTTALGSLLAARSEITGACVAFEPYAFDPSQERFAPYLYRTHKKGDIISRPLGDDYEYTHWDWYRVVKEKQKSYWTDPYHDAGGSDQLVCTYSLPLRRADKFIGVITIDVSIATIRECLEVHSSAPFFFADQGIEFFMMNSRGKLISDESEKIGESFKEYAKRTDRPQLVALAKQIMAGNYEICVLTNDERLSSFFSFLQLENISVLLGSERDDNEDTFWFFPAPLPQTRWSLVAYVPDHVIFLPVYRELRFRALILIVGFVVIGAILLIVSRKITAPILSLANFAEELATSNDLTMRVPPLNTRDETAALATTINHMVEALQNSLQQQIEEKAASQAIERELLFARKIQESLLPRQFPPFPERTEFTLHALNEPARMMAGDFYDYFFLDSDTLVLVMADVSGKGPAAAMFMAVSRTALRDASRLGRSPEETMNHVNAVLSRDNDASMFVTVFYAHYNVRTGKMRYVNAGHNPPYILRFRGGRELLPATGLFLAAMDDTQYDADEISLEAGDILVTFTDGVTEAHIAENNSGEIDLYGEARLEALLEANRKSDVVSLCEKIVEEVDAFSQNARHDDITILILKNS